MLKKRIGVVMYQTSTSKGQELVAQRMVREFIKIGHDAYLITSVYHDGVEVVSPKSLRKGAGYTYIEDSELRIPVIRVDSHIARWPPRRVVFRDFMSTLTQIVDRFQLDVLITHSTLWNGPEEVAKFIEWRRDMRSIGGYKDPLVFCHMSHFQEPSLKRYSLKEQSFRVAWNKLTLPQIFSTANLILVVTDLEKKAKIKIGAKAEKCFLFPGGIDDEMLRYANVEVKSLLSRLSTKRRNVKVISYLGSLEERKNPLAVLKVAERLQDREDIHFVIAGRGDSAYSKRVVETANQLPNVTYLGELNEQEKVQLIKASYLNILLSQLEALGLTQLEFMCFGVPIITSAVGGQAWLIRNEVEGLHVNGSEDVEGAVAAINRLVSNQTLWGRLSANAKKRAMSLTMSTLTAGLDEAITKELIKERGLSKIPSEARGTLAEPENVLKSWSSGSWGVIATGRRLFIKRGFISRKVTEIPYSNISSIEYTRRYAWKTVIAGAAISLFLLVEPFLEPIFSRAFVAKFNDFMRIFLPASFLESPILATFIDLLPIIPIAVATIAFVVEAKVGFTLRGPGIKALYVPGKFREAIAFVRRMQDGARPKE
jgi:D-inositol-3-phosphate glycosyltransferase